MGHTWWVEQGQGSNGPSAPSPRVLAALCAAGALALLGYLVVTLPDDGMGRIPGSFRPERVADYLLELPRRIAPQRSQQQ
jgi:hypothetical protein